MIQNVEILYSTGKILRSKFNDSLIIVDDNNQDIKKHDTFYIEVKELSNTAYLRYLERIINIYITYVPIKKDEIKERILEVQNNLTNIFDISFKVSNRNLLIDNKSFNYDETFLSMNMTLKFLDDKSNDNMPDMDKYSQLMEELNLTLNEKED